MECEEPCEVRVEKRCVRCDVWKDLDTGFRPGNHVCRLCRNAMVKKWTSSNTIRREIIRIKARRSAYVKRLSKRQKLDDNSNDYETNVPAVADRPMQTTTDDEQVERV